MEPGNIPHVSLLCKNPFRPRDSGALLRNASIASLLEKAKGTMLKGQILVSPRVEWGGMFTDVYIQRICSCELRGMLQRFHGNSRPVDLKRAEPGRIPWPV